MKRTLAVSAVALVLAAAGLFGSGTTNPLSTPSAAAQGAPTLQQGVFAIENMTCALCPMTVKKAIAGVPGVKSVTVDFDAKTATVLFDPAKATVSAIIQASTNAGYPARAIKH